ncbi:MAG: Basal-body rod modification protein FlgD [candidate division BRC1 bacterium ADurb.BinA364]|nr:MAG: Basal-body rod modification protein FlgD [candidate division BRC1 bacterium ADurb.BinA364]
MSAISAIGNPIAYMPPASSSASGANMGKQDFLLLLIEQMKAQDPLNPQDPSEFTAQLAQFSSLEQLYNLGDSLQTLSMLSASVNNMAAGNFLGREVLVQGSNIYLQEGGASALRYNLGAEAASVRIDIYNASGAKVRTIDLGPQQSGEGRFVWDGEMTAGGKAPDGVYTASITATGANGDPLYAATRMTGRVTGVVYQNGVTYLDLSGQLVPIAEVMEIRP